MRRPTTHQSDTPSVSTPMRPVAAAVRRPQRGAAVERLEHEPQRGRDRDEQQRRRVDAADGEDDQREQRGVAPTSAADRADGEPTSHGRPAHGSSSTEMRAVNASWYGVSMYTSAPASAPAAPGAEHREQPARAEHRGAARSCPARAAARSSRARRPGRTARTTGPSGTGSRCFWCGHRARPRRAGPRGRAPAPSRRPGSR